MKLTLCHKKTKGLYIVASHLAFIAQIQLKKNPKTPKRLQLGVSNL